ncbi:hypothetical protein AB0F81_21760 [Actinoplanes sp. NPDC024001]|uniref:hypothetical protein n=1 Tax=Actinoplanes sp. NPDC024001 TaxID=3154598 RepID=UPI0034048C61
MTKRWWGLLAGVFAVAGLAWSGLFAMDRASSGPVATPVSPTPLFISCIRVEGTPSPCDSFANYRLWRRPLEDYERTAAEKVRANVEAAVPSATPAPGVTEIASALAGAGLVRAIVRTARAEDPAPLGSVMLAVPVGRACVLGFHDDGVLQA